MDGSSLFAISDTNVYIKSHLLVPKWRSNHIYILRAILYTKLDETVLSFPHSHKSNHIQCHHQIMEGWCEEIVHLQSETTEIKWSFCDAKHNEFSNLTLTIWALDHLTSIKYSFVTQYMNSISPISMSKWTLQEGIYLQYQQEKYAMNTGCK